MQPKILLITPSLALGGAENQLTLLAIHLKRRGLPIRVFSLEKEGFLRSTLSHHQITVHDGGLDSNDLRKRPWRILWVVGRLIKVMAHYRPSVVHAVLPLAAYLSALSARIMKVPLIITSRRALGTHQERYPFLKIPDRMANRLSHYVTVNSMAVWNDTIRRDAIDPSKLVLIHNGLDVSKFKTEGSQRQGMRRSLGLDADDKVVVTIANLIPYKGHSDLLRTIQIAAKKINHLKVLLVGEDRGIQARLMKEAAALQIDGHVRFLGLRQDASELLAACDLSVLPSHEEGFSNVLLESMAAGLPIVATDVGGNAEAVINGVTGWLTPPYNPAGLAEKMVDLLINPQKAKAWGARARARVEDQFSVERMVEKHLAVYQRRPWQ